MPTHRTLHRRATAAGALCTVAALVAGCQVAEDPEPDGEDASASAPGETSAAQDHAAPSRHSGSGGESRGEVSAGEGSSGVAAPPWQEASPPLTEEEEIYGTSFGEPLPEHGEWEIPDPRPTGITFLELLGEPRIHRAGPDTFPVFDMADSGPIDQGGPDPITGQTWSYWAEPVTDRVEDVMWPYGVDIQVTGWEDGREAIDLLREDGLNDSWADTFELGEWAGHEDDGDRVAFQTHQLDAMRDEGGEPEPIARYRGIVAIRTGDYIIGVSVTGDSADSADALSREIATKSAENLAVLDPEHGSD